MTIFFVSLYAQTNKDIIMTRKLFIAAAAFMAIFAGCTPKEEFKETLSVNPTTIKLEGSRASTIVEVISITSR